MRYLAELREGDAVTEIFLCRSKQVLVTKAGKTYYSLILQDSSGTIDAKIWDLGPGIHHFESYDFVKVQGNITSFQGALQMNIRQLRTADEGEYVPKDYFPETKGNVDEMLQSILQYIDEIEEKHLKMLAKAFFVDDKEFVKKFKQHSAAKNVHHSFIGGLLEHTFKVMQLCEYYCKQYAILNKDLLMVAALFHDVGKIKEISAFPQNDYTDYGQLIGHIVIGIEMVSKEIDKIQGFPEKLAYELKHCIAAHHGELEYGSPKKPALVEAIALNFADNTDAKMQTMIEIFEASDSDDWLGYNRLFESNLRKTSI